MTEEKRNILDIICSGRKPTLPLTVEEASILYAVFTACHKLNIREIMVEEKREELEEGLRKLYDVPEIEGKLRGDIFMTQYWLADNENFDFSSGMFRLFSSYYFLETYYWKYLMQYCGEEWDSLLKDRFAPSEEWISENRNIIDEICLVKDRSKIFPVSEEEAEIVSVVYDVFEKADLKTIIAKNQREELVEAIQFLLRVPEIWQSHEFACWAIIAFGKAKGKKDFDFKQDMKGFMDCYKRIDLFYRECRRKKYQESYG